MHFSFSLIFFVVVNVTALGITDGNTEYNHPANPGTDFYPSNVDLPTVKDEGRVNRTRNWLLNQALPAVAQTFPRCNVKPVTWANCSAGHLLLLDQSQVTQWLDASSAHYLADSRNRRSIVKKTTMECYFLFVYSPKCPFSVAAFPFVKAVARAFPQLDFLAVRVEDYVMHRWSLRMLYVPKLKFMASGRILREYAGSDTDLDGMIDFVWSNAHQLPKGPVGLRSEDYRGNPAMPQPKDTQFLVLSWLTVLASIIYFCCVFGPRMLSRFSHCRIILALLGANQDRSPPGTVLTWDPIQPPDAVR